MRRAKLSKKSAVRSGKRSGKRSSPQAGQVPGSLKVSVVIPVMNEVRTIGKVIERARRVHSNTEIIVVANGSTDGTKEAAARMGAKVISYDRPLGHDVGRSIGAREAKGDIILFTDGDIAVTTKQLLPLVRAVRNGVDVALNNYNGPVKTTKVHSVVLAKHALNAVLERPDLRGTSMTTIPHAISRRALNAIEPDALAVPPKALAIAAAKGLRIAKVNLIPVGSLNRRRNRIRNGHDPLAELITGDHLEAIHWLIQATNERGALPDLFRVRDVWG